MKKYVGSYAFDLSPRVPLQLGRESISNSTTAISELVKNAYDADANQVNITFYKLEKPISIMVIEDDGYGMDNKTLISSWLRIGTENKTVNPLSRGGRVLTGAKGLGRLGIDRLCKKVILQTKSIGQDSFTQLEIDWKKYEDFNKGFFDIKHKVHEINLPYSDKYGEVFKNGSGTRIILLGLKDDWQGYIQKDLARELRLLVSPFNNDNDFKINLNFNKENIQSLDSSTILDYARWSVESSINVDGMITAAFKYKDTEVKKYTVEWNEWIKNRNDKPVCGPIDFKFYYIPRESIEKSDLKVGQIRSFLDANQGVRLYRDGFRVRPYGEPSGKGDWLDLGLRKVKSPEGIKQGSWKVGPNVVVGAVFISREKNVLLNDQANREGIVEGDAFYDIRAFVLKIIEKFEGLAIERAQKGAESKPKIEINELKNHNIQDNDELVDIRRKLNESIKKKNAKRSDLKFIAKNLLKVAARQEKQNAKVNELLDHIENLKDTMANLASLGILTVCLGHESRQQASMATANVATLRRMIDKEEKNERTSHFLKKLEAIDSSVKYISDFAGFALSNVKPDKRNMKKVNIDQVIDYVIHLFETTLHKSNIQIIREWNKEEEYCVRGYQIHWESIIINFLTNSLWAMEKKVEGERFIKIMLKRVQEKFIELHFSDSGCGIESGEEKRIFETGFSTKTDPKGNVTGTGMGLSIVRNFLADYKNGKMEVIPKSELGGAEFIIMVPLY